jgi:septum formation protein
MHRFMTRRTLLLASASPRRRRLLAAAGFAFSVEPADIEECIVGDEDALETTTRLAAEKAEAVAVRAASDSVVLAADTTVVCDGEQFGKPADEASACDMLKRLSGRNHEVITAWTAIVAGSPPASLAITGHTRSIVRMRELSMTEIRDYVAGGEPMDKAGAYAVQGTGRAFVAAVLGSVDNVIGLPIAQVTRGLGLLGVMPEPR